MNTAGLPIVSPFRAMCARTTVRRSLAAASLYMLCATQAQALPFGYACLSDRSQAASNECRLVSDGTLPVSVDVLATAETSSTFFGSIANQPPAFELNAVEPGQLLFSFTIHKSGIDVIASMGNETLPTGMREMPLDNGASDPLADPYPVDHSSVFLLISSGIVGVGTTSRRRRGLRLLSEVHTPRTLRKEVSSRTPVAPSLFAQRSTQSTPLRI